MAAKFATAPVRFLMVFSLFGMALYARPDMPGTASRAAAIEIALKDLPSPEMPGRQVGARQVGSRQVSLLHVSAKR